MGLGFGLLGAQLRPGETDWTRAYDETMRLAVDAERLGYSSVWTTEHHFVDDGYMPSLAVVSAAIAAATDAIEIGTGVILAPMHDPIRLAEDAATVHLLSHGRFVLGVGLGWSEVEFEVLGVPKRLRGAAMEEILRILPRAWSGAPFRHDGDVYSIPEVGVRPVPSSPIPVLVGGGAEPAIRRAARLADGIFANAPVDRFLRQLDWVREELDRAGRDPDGFRVIHYSVMLPGSSPDEALGRYERDLWHMMWKYSDMEESARRPLPPPEAPPLDPERRDRLFGRSTIAGTGEQIVEHLHEIRDRAGMPVEFVARSHFATLPYDDQLELMERLATEVAPHI